MQSQELANVRFDFVQLDVPFLQIWLVFRGEFGSGNIGVTEFQAGGHEPAIPEANVENSRVLLSWKKPTVFPRHRVDHGVRRRLTADSNRSQGHAPINLGNKG